MQKIVPQEINLFVHIFVDERLISCALVFVQRRPFEKKNANDSEIFHTILQKMTSISWQYICHQRRLISSESYSLAQEVDKKFLKDFYSMISISYLYIYSYKRLISCGHIIIERDHLENRLISCKTSLSTKDQSFFSNFV